MHFPFSTLALSIFLVPVFAALHFTNTAFDVVIGEPFVVTWAGGTDPDPATLTLRGSAFPGGSTVLASGLTDHSYTWTPDKTLLDTSSTYFFEIEVTFELISSNDFKVQGGNGAASSTPSSSSPSSSSSASSTEVAKASSTPTPATLTSDSGTSPTQSTSSSTSGNGSSDTSSTSTAPTPSNTTESRIVANSKLKPGAIGGIFVAILAVILGIITLIWFILRRRRQQREKEQETADLQTPELEGGTVTGGSKQYELDNAVSQGGDTEKPELANDGQEPFPVFSNEDPFSKPELSASPQNQYPTDHNKSYDVAVTGLVAELDGWRRHNGMDHASPGISPGELATHSPASAVSSPRTVFSMQQPNTQSPERAEPRSEFAHHPPWTDDGSLNQSAATGVSAGEGGVAVEGDPGNSDDEYTRLVAEQRRMSAEITQAERVKELKAQKIAVEERLTLLKGKSGGSGAGKAPS